jgi:hypothetical protein
MNWKVIALGLIVSVSSFAHEGHDHDAPTTLKAPKGGVIKALDEASVEVVYKGKNIKVYVYDKDTKPANASRFQIEAKTLLPKAKKEESLILQAKDTFFEAEYDAKGKHRYSLKLNVTDSKTGRTDPLTFTIEPRK